MISCFVDGFRDAESTSRFVENQYGSVRVSIYPSIESIVMWGFNLTKVGLGAMIRFSRESGMSSFKTHICHLFRLPHVTSQCLMAHNSQLITHKYCDWQRTTTTKYYQPPPQTTTNHHPATTTQCFQLFISGPSPGLETHATPLLDTSIGRQVANLQRVEEGPKSWNTSVVRSKVAKCYKHLTNMSGGTFRFGGSKNILGMIGDCLIFSVKDLLKGNCRWIWG